MNFQSSRAEEKWKFFLSFFFTSIFKNELLIYEIVEFANFNKSLLQSFFLKSKKVVKFNFSQTGFGIANS